MKGRKHVTVAIEGRLNIPVAWLLLDSEGMRVLGDEGGRTGMAQVVVAEAVLGRREAMASCG